MRAGEHAAVRDRAGSAVTRLRRSGLLALAAFAALLTLVLPAPAFARPTSTTGAAIATTGAGATSGTPAERRTVRTEVARTARSLSWRTTASTRKGAPSAEVSSLAHATAVSHTGPALTAALLATGGGSIVERAAGAVRREQGAPRAAALGACGSRSPPAA